MSKKGKSRSQKMYDKEFGNHILLFNKLTVSRTKGKSYSSYIAISLFNS